MSLAAWILAAVLVLVIIVPPLALFRETFHLFRRVSDSTGAMSALALFSAALIFVILNAAYLRVTVPDMADSIFMPDRYFAGALFVSWLSVWLRRTLRRKRRRRVRLA